MESRDEEVRGWAAGHEHKIVYPRRTTRAARKNPFERKNLAPYLTDPHLIVQYQGIVGASVDRFSRDGNLNKFKEWVADNGKKLFVVSPPLIWPIAKIDPLRVMYQIQWDLLSNLAEAELAAISERYRKMKAFLKSQGTVWGRAPFGFEIVGEPKSKTLRGRELDLPYILKIYEMRGDGASYDQIAAWLTAQGVETYKHRLWAARPADSDRGPEPSAAWSGTTVRQIIKNPAYMGIVCERDWSAKAITYGAKIMECEPLVDAATWQQANGISGDNKRKPSALDPAMLHGGILHCLNCGGPMYRMTSSGTRWKARADGTRVRYKQNGPDYYRCRGGKPDWKSCGNMVRVQLADEALGWWMSGNHGQIYVQTIIRGHTDREIELAEIAYALQQLPIRSLSRTEEQTERERLWAEEDRVKALPDEPDRVESVPAGETYGSAWAKLPPAERSPWLKKMKKHVFAGKTGLELREADGPVVAVIPFDRVNQMPPELASMTGTLRRT